MNFKSLLLGALAVVGMTCLYNCSDNTTEDAVKAEITAQENPIEARGGAQYLSVKASGSWNISCKGEDGNAPKWVTISQTNGSGSKSSIPMEVKPNTTDAERVAIVTLRTGHGKATLTLTQKAWDSSVTTGDKAKVGWLELPGMPEGTELGFFTHSMTIGNTKTRNYSFAYDYDNMVAHWVAYPLNAWTIGSGKRTDKWGADPLIPADKQAVLYNGFKEGNAGWFARGHQCPSADRLNYEANVMTFYYTNMTPQIQDGFNGDIWEQLESKVRGWAKKSGTDTCYVVTGCVPDGSTKYALDNNGKKITVPVAYYKAVLRYSKSGKEGHSGYMGFAIYLEHKVYSSSAIKKEYCMSISDLEKRINVNLFANLPSVVGPEEAQTIKAENPADVAWWW